jgi:hypothetical protein
MNIDAGTVAAIVAALNLVLTIGGGGYFAGKLSGKVQRIERDVSETKGLLVTSAVEADRLRRAEADIDNLEADFRNLRKGVGWINDNGAQGVNREY